MTGCTSRDEADRLNSTWLSQSTYTCTAASEAADCERALDIRELMMSSWGQEVLWTTVCRVFRKEAIRDPESVIRNRVAD